MFDRRGFLQTSCVLASIPGISQATSAGPISTTNTSPMTAVQNEYEQFFAASPDLELLGLPRDWSVVREGFHPFSPERVLILTSNTHSRLGWNNDLIRKRAWERAEKARLQNGPNWVIPDEKFDVLVTATDRFASYYQRPDLIEKWAFGLVRREALSPTGLGKGLGVLHQFQPPIEKSVATDSALVDWWLVLCPGGINFQSLDDLPVYVLFAPIFDQPCLRFETEVLGLFSQALRTLPFPQPHDASNRDIYCKDIAGMDRVTAARFLNYQLARYLQEFRKPSTSTKAGGKASTDFNS